MIGGRRLQPRLPASAVAALRALADEARRDAQANYRLNGFIKLLNLTGWTNTAIAEAIGVSRERIRQRLHEGAEMRGLPEAPPVPTPPTPMPAPPVRKRLMVKPEIAGRLVELSDSARTVNGSTRPDDPRRADSVELTAMLASLVAQGVTTTHLADVLGVTHFAIRSRLARHGYRQGPPSIADVHYKGVQSPHIGGAHQTHCRRGHEFAGDNLRLVNGDPAHRVCRACERLRKANYTARKLGRPAEAVAS